MSTTILLQCGRDEEIEAAGQVTVAVRVAGEGADLSELYTRVISIPDSEYSQIFTDSLSLDGPAEEFLRDCFDKDFERVLGRTMTALEAEAILWDEEQFVVRTNSEQSAVIRKLTLAEVAGCNRFQRLCQIAQAAAARRQGFTAAVGRDQGYVVLLIDSTDRDHLRDKWQIPLWTVQP